MLPTLAQRLRMAPILVAPGVYDPLSALIAQQAGCEALFVSGAALSLAQHGLPDCGLMTATQLADMVARIADRVRVPVLVDGDSGYGNAAHLQQLVRNLCRAGAAAVQIEDQLPVKPAGVIRARPLVTASEMVGKIKAAQDARDSADFLISARTDALASTGLDDALARGETYIRAGCDLLFIEGVTTLDQVSAMQRAFGDTVPLVHNLLESGGTPFANVAAAQVAGFALALFPASALGAAAHGMAQAYAAIVARGATDGVAMTGMSALNGLVGTADFAQAIAHYAEADI
jgi:2-methylisocitrate lyase-like PEP mutase family enzyme